MSNEQRITPHGRMIERLGGLAGGSQAHEQVALLQAQVKNLEREVERLQGSARSDVRSQKMFDNKRQAFEIRYREVKYQLQAMKRMGKQAGLACRYVAQGMENSDPERAADIRFLGQLLNDDLWGTTDIGGVKAPDLVKHTQYYLKAKNITKGEDANP